jgi:glutamyl-Q tRNA(Asp) synthetase
VAALASWLDARAQQGLWLVRIENVDTPRTVPGAAQRILQQLLDCGLVPDEPPVFQSERTASYQEALQCLIAAGLAYPCCCSRKDMAVALMAQGIVRPRQGEWVYPGTCARGMPPAGAQHGTRLAWRLRTAFSKEKEAVAPVEPTPIAMNAIAPVTCWTDRRLGPQQQAVSTEVGDFVLQRADGCFTYQLAVVVDDAAQGITHVVRGDDLADNTARQILLQRALELPTPVYLHTPLVVGANGEKLSKQNGAQAMDTSGPAAALVALSQAARVLGLPEMHHANRQEALQAWTASWRCAYPLA